MLSDRYTTGYVSDRYHTEPEPPSRREAERDERECGKHKRTVSLPVDWQDFIPNPADRPEA